MQSEIEKKAEPKMEEAVKESGETKEEGSVTAEGKLEEEMKIEGGKVTVETNLKECDEKTKAAKDIEAGEVAGALYPKMTEDPKARWSFIRKVYLILAVQVMIAAGVAATFNSVRPLSRFVVHSKAAGGLFAVTLVLPFIAMVPMMMFRKRHPLNLVFLFLFTLCMSLQLGWIAAYMKGMFLLEAAFVTTVVLIGLTLYTFWAARRGQDFNRLGPFLFSSLVVFLMYLIFKICFPVVDITLSIYGCIASIVHSGLIIYDTDKLIKRHKYDEYTIAAVSLYLDVTNLFLSLFFIPTFTVD